MSAQRDALYAAVEAASAALKAFPKGPMGLTPDAVKASPAWRDARQRYQQAFAALRAFNARAIRARARR